MKQDQSKQSHHYIPSKYNIVSAKVDGRVAIYNTLTQGLYEVDVADYFEPDSKSLERLLESSLYVHRSVDELSRCIQVREADRSVRRNTMDLIVVPSFRCNFSCTYCINGTSFGEGEVKYSKDSVDAAVELARQELSGYSALNVTWHGGEPLVASAEIDRGSKVLQDIASAHDVSYGAEVVTNGVLIEKVLLPKVDDWKIQKVQVSLDWPPAGSDRALPHQSPFNTLLKVLRGVSKLPRSVRKHIRVNVFPGFLESFSDFIALVKDEVGVSTEIYTHQIVMSDYGDVSVYEHLIQENMVSFRSEQLEAKRMLRDAGFEQPYFPSGIEVPLCVAQDAHSVILGPSGRKLKCFAELRGSQAASVGEQGPNQRAMEYNTFEGFEVEQCRECSYLPICHGGCARSAVRTPEEVEARCTPWRFSLADELTEMLKQNTEERSNDR